MRPLVFDFADDAEALQQEHEYMFGRSLLVNPVTEPNVTEWTTYLPRHAGGWYDRLTGRHYEGGQPLTVRVFPYLFVPAASCLQGQTCNRRLMIFIV